jgi:hypothetical protein
MRGPSTCPAQQELTSSVFQQDEEGTAVTFEADRHNSVQAETLRRVGDIDFADLIASRGSKLLSLARYISVRRVIPITLTRPLLGDLLSEAAQLEELLDAYGARNNRQWSRFRSLTAAIKLFAGVGYELLHIRHALPFYRLMAIEQVFVTSTVQSLALTRNILVKATSWICFQASRLGLPIPGDQFSETAYSEHLPPGRLPHDRATRKIKSASETVTHLVTAFLNLDAESTLLHTVAQVQAEEYASCFPDPISEENLRYLKFRFHNLQSLYDTHVSETEIEYFDSDLPILRGHISIVYHLLVIATELAHYYERHLNAHTGDSALRRKPVVSSEALLGMLINYSIAYASAFLSCGRRFCYTMLKRYAQVGRIEAPVPSYRGFHVRPATLVARIVQHYGSEVSMELDDQSYDAGSPMDIFRANEKINAQKRRWLVSEIALFTLPLGDLEENQIRATVLRVVLRLAGQGKLIIYQQPLQLSETFSREGILLEKVTTEIARLQATGQIDIKTDLNITFIGDKRVLTDLELLAKSGYGEDNFGNNIPLPKELAYLRR